eukprot:CAMPEP_0184290146 /NCGR_PEP_ID=MMETSP1049-20130417/2487_1 /TAXON_ID=77928 /ORGANISM="Proteomonas sulcata, Strain CCMP704" /LENGTH=92 /DNA_ID=CAMNT_0026597227 /DNA_START=401 /DNA_END=679 /DNA_ORIENTATION=+
MSYALLKHQSDSPSHPSQSSWVDRSIGVLSRSSQNIEPCYTATSSKHPFIGIKNGPSARWPGLGVGLGLNLVGQSGSLRIPLQVLTDNRNRW